MLKGKMKNIFDVPSYENLFLFKTFSEIGNLGFGYSR
jgi:hypothetical protein